MALIESRQGGVRLSALGPAAEAEGLTPGLPLADARARVPGLSVAWADPAADLRALGAAADWCTGIWTPWAAAAPPDGLRLDVTGGAHLFGGEAAMVAEIDGRFARLGHTARVAVADTPGAADVCARVGAGGVVPPGETARALAPLPVAGLRLPAATLDKLDRLGLRRIGDLMALPRTALAKRFGRIAVQRLDQALGHAADPISPRAPAPDWRERLAFAEPIARRDDLDVALDQLLSRLCTRLAEAGAGVRRLTYTLYRVDSTTQTLAIGTGQPANDPGHLARLFAPKLADIAPGFGIEAAVLHAPDVEVRVPSQVALDSLDSPRATAGDTLARLLDRIENRIGAGRVYRLLPRESHRPERAVHRAVPTGQVAPGHPPRPLAPRPVWLLPRPEPIAPVQPAFQGGPERLAPEWWREDPGTTREYYRIADDAGRRLWVFREPRTRRWYLHGLLP